MANVHPEIRQQWERMEDRKQQIQSLIRPLTEEIYLLKPSPAAWSVGQIANHLYLSEKFSFAYLRKKMSYPDTIPPYHFKSWRNYYLTKFVLWSPMKWKAPPYINMSEIKEVLTPSELEQKWSVLREEMSSYIEETYPQFKHFLVYNHPFSGRMTMKQMLMFFSDHMDHHLRQANRILHEVERKGK